MRAVVASLALLLSSAAFACPMHAQASAWDAEAAKVAEAEGEHVTLSVEGLTCGDCSSKVTAALTAIDGVNAAAVDHVSGQAVIAFDGAKVQSDALIAAVVAAGYKAEVKPAQG